MENKYFAKYLPVEGEIKEEDYVEIDKFELVDGKLQKVGRWVLPMLFFLTPQFGTEPLSLEDTVKNLKEGANCKKVKLFLCSKDIQVGDKDVYVEPQAVENYQKGLRFEVVNLELLEKDYLIADIKYLANPTKPSSVGHVREWPCDAIWKVIGEISSKATWIKEGDGFDEYQIWAKNIPFFGDRHVMIQPHAWSQERTEEQGWSEEIIKLKGPCGYFH